MSEIRQETNRNVSGHYSTRKYETEYWWKLRLNLLRSPKGPRVPNSNVSNGTQTLKKMKMVEVVTVADMIPLPTKSKLTIHFLSFGLAPHTYFTKLKVGQY